MRKPVVRFSVMLATAIVASGCQADSPPAQAAAPHAPAPQTDRLVVFKPGASAQQTAADRSDCRQSSKSFNAYGGPMTYSSPTHNDALFGNCMKARGYYTRRLSDLYVPFRDVEVQGIAAPHRKEWLKKTCLNPAFAAYFARTPCELSEMTPAQMNDSARISPEEKAALLDLRRVEKAMEDEADEILRNGTPRGRETAKLYRSTYQPQVDKADLDLCNGAITWGTYNKRLVEIFLAYLGAAMQLRS